MVTHPSTNRAQRRLTWLIETKALSLRQTASVSSIAVRCGIYSYVIFPIFIQRRRKIQSASRTRQETRRTSMPMKP